jgi:hypothetical protein
MNTEDRIRQRAYELWERDGRPDGHADTHWERAAQEIAAEDGSMPHPPVGSDVPGPDAGLRTPPSAIERSLQEAAEALRETHEESAARDEPAAHHPRSRRTAPETE